VGGYLKVVCGLSIGLEVGLSGVGELGLGIDGWSRMDLGNSDWSGMDLGHGNGGCGTVDDGVESVDGVSRVGHGPN
jgi:hypothetical protein